MRRLPRIPWTGLLVFLALWGLLTACAPEPWPSLWAALSGAAGVLVAAVTRPAAGRRPGPAAARVDSAELERLRAAAPPWPGGPIDLAPDGTHHLLRRKLKDGRAHCAVLAERADGGRVLFELVLPAEEFDRQSALADPAEVDRLVRAANRTPVAR